MDGNAEAWQENSMFPQTEVCFCSLIKAQMLPIPPHP